MRETRFPGTLEPPLPFRCQPANFIAHPHALFVQMSTATKDFDQPAFGRPCGRKTWHVLDSWFLSGCSQFLISARPATFDDIASRLQVIKLVKQYSWQRPFGHQKICPVDSSGKNLPSTTLVWSLKTAVFCNCLDLFSSDLPIGCTAC